MAKRKLPQYDDPYAQNWKGQLYKVIDFASKVVNKGPLSKKEGHEALSWYLTAADDLKTIPESVTHLQLFGSLNHEFPSFGENLVSLDLLFITINDNKLLNFLPQLPPSLKKLGIYLGYAPLLENQNLPLLKSLEIHEDRWSSFSQVPTKIAHQVSKLTINHHCPKRTPYSGPCIDLTHFLNVIHLFIVNQHLPFAREVRFFPPRLLFLEMNPGRNLSWFLNIPLTLEYVQMNKIYHKFSLDTSMLERYEVFISSMNYPKKKKETK